MKAEHREYQRRLDRQVKAAARVIRDALGRNAVAKQSVVTGDKGSVPGGTAMTVSIRPILLKNSKTTSIRFFGSVSERVSIGP